MSDRTPTNGSKPLALQLAKRLTDSSIPLPERANLARHIRGSESAKLVEALTYAIALLPRH
jgi:hypothetical protein